MKIFTIRTTAKLLAFSFAASALTLQAASASNQDKRATFVGGGATLPALAYEGANATSMNPSVPSPGSVFYYFEHFFSSNPQVTVQYCQTGSGFGKKVFDGAAGATAVNLTCPAFGVKPTVGVNGFGAPAALGLTDPDVTGSDSPLTQAEYTQFITSKASTRTEPVELPEVVGSIALMYNNPDTHSTQINLTDAQICGLANGTITNWSQLGLPARALHFVYRSDGSGTTFGFSNHIQKVCPSYGFNVSQQFAPTTPPATPTVVAAPPPGSIGASGNPKVVSTITSTSGAIGYAEAANALKARVPANGINFALVNLKDPIRNLPETAAAISESTSVARDSAVQTNGGAATVAPLSPPPAHPGCVLLVKPSAYANVTASGAGYKIVAVSYQLYSYSGNGHKNTTSDNTSNLRKLAELLTFPNIRYANQTSPNITSMDRSTTTPNTGRTGYSTLGASFTSPVYQAANSCINA